MSTSGLIQLIPKHGAYTNLKGGWDLTWVYFILFFDFLLIKKRVVNIPTVHGCTNYYDMMKRANIDSICKFNILSNKIMKLVHVVFFWNDDIYDIYTKDKTFKPYFKYLHDTSLYLCKKKTQKTLKIKTKIIIYICKKFVKIRSLENFPMLLK